MKALSLLLLITVLADSSVVVVLAGGTCSGRPRSCSTQSSHYFCGNVDGCYWWEHLGCIGSAMSCSNYARSLSCHRQGCSWKQDSNGGSNNDEEESFGCCTGVAPSYSCDHKYVDNGNDQYHCAQRSACIWVDDCRFQSALYVDSESGGGGGGITHGAIVGILITLAILHGVAVFAYWWLIYKKRGEEPAVTRKNLAAAIGTVHRNCIEKYHTIYQ